MKLPAAAALLATSLALGCASVNPRPAFEDVDRKLRERTDATVQWARTVAETEEQERVVRELLKEELTVERAVQVTLLNNRSLQATFEEVGVSHADLVQAGLLSNPSVFLSLRFPRSPPPRVNDEFGIAKDFLDFLIRPLRKKLAAAELEETKLLVGSKVLDLIAEVKTAYYTLQARQQLVRRLRLISEINQAAAEFAERQHAAGNMNDLDLANNQAIYEQSRVDVALTEVQARSDREKLNRLLGLWGEATSFQMAEQLPPIPSPEIPFERLEALAMETRLDVAAARWGVDIVARALALRKGTRYFPVGINVGIDTEKDSDRHRVTGPIVELQLPIFDYGQASIARLESQLRQAQRQLEAEAINARSEVREARDLLIAARDLTRYYETVLLPKRVQILDLTLQHFNMMLKGAYDLLIAKQGQVSTEKAYVEAWRDYWIARAQLERGVGGKLPTPEEGKEP